MSSFMRKNRERIMAEKAAKTAAENGEVDMASQPESQLMLAKLGRDKNQLSKIESRVSKNLKKAEFLADYDAYIDGAIAADEGIQDDVISTLMLWHIDCKNVDRALEIAEYVFKHDIKMPEQFTRPTATVVIEQLSDLALIESDHVTLDQLQALLQLVKVYELDMLDEVRAKLHKALGNALIDSDPEKAINHFESASTLNPASGVKGTLKRLRKEQEQAKSA